MVGNPDIERQLSALELLNAAITARAKALPKSGPIMVQ
jgi:hypothetical protein